MPSLRSIPRRALVLAVIAAVGAITYFAWFRDSSLVAVRDVKVENIESSDRGQVVSALTRAAEGMTTLHVQTDRLSDAVSDVPTVASVSADPSLPHGLTIHVTEYRPALVAVEGDRKVPVAADGSVLPGARVTGSLPQLPVASLPGSGRLSGKALAEALTLGAAPDPLRPLIEGTTVDDTYGVLVTMRGGIQLRFGSDGNRKAQWAAAAAVLADPSLDALTYIDLRVPERPAVGGSSTPSPEATPVTPGSATTTPSAPVTTVP
jgi:cell division protein FtsQ